MSTLTVPLNGLLMIVSFLPDGSRCLGETGAARARSRICTCKDPCQLSAPHHPTRTKWSISSLGHCRPLGAAHRAATVGRPALLAQLVEHLHGKEGVDGSSPSEGFPEYPCKSGYFVVVLGNDRWFRGCTGVHAGLHERRYIPAVGGNRPTPSLPGKWSGIRATCAQPSNGSVMERTGAASAAALAVVASAVMEPRRSATLRRTAAAVGGFLFLAVAPLPSAQGARPSGKPDPHRFLSWDASSHTLRSGAQRRSWPP